MTGPILKRSRQWVLIYPGQRMVMVISFGFASHNGRRTFSVMEKSEHTTIDIADAPEEGLLTDLTGEPPDISGRQLEIYEAVERGDYSWANKTARNHRADESASIFVPPDVTLDHLATLTNARPWPQASTSDAYQWFQAQPDNQLLIRNLHPTLHPDPNTPQDTALQRDATRWGGYTSHELVAKDTETLAHAIRTIADHHDISIITVADRYRTRTDIINFDNAYGEGWLVDYFQQTDIFIGPLMVSPPARPTEYWPLAWPLRYFTLTYTNGDTFTLPGHNHTTTNNRHHFTATLTNGRTITLAWATTPGTQTIQPTEPNWQLPPPIT